MDNNNLNQPKGNTLQDNPDTYKCMINTRVSESVKKGLKDLAKRNKRKMSDYNRLLYEFAIENDLSL